jgi:hypothetical protein
MDSSLEVHLQTRHEVVLKAHNIQICPHLTGLVSHHGNPSFINLKERPIEDTGEIKEKLVDCFIV